MTSLTVFVKQEIPVRYLRARCGVRYWEDGWINGVEDSDGSRIPCREGTSADNDRLGGGNWCPTIDLETGIIEKWPQGTTADLHYKVCDDGFYELLNEMREVVASVDGYVIDMMCPEPEGFGDYVIMKIDESGKIANFEPSFVEFEKAANPA